MISMIRIGLDCLILFSVSYLDDINFEPLPVLRFPSYFVYLFVERYYSLGYYSMLDQIPV